ncbi:aminopeptidase N [Yoonia sp. 208BN28-4]|uniref:aminopeptidase N n=1 Tax=Yoonia sp. 208BN28-4 TaxID=3126505 RepID=UPI0030AC523B
MKDASPQTIYLADYQPPAFLIDGVHLTFRLSPKATRVISRIRFRPNPDATDTTFTLHGQDLKLVNAQIDGADVSPTLTDNGLTCDVPDAPFVWDAEVEIAPDGNTALEGLYMSGGMYCTQCEAEGFRKITYYPDRPDVMAVFTVRIESDMPVMLSNGNPVGSGAGWAEWHDSWPKPAYLFALVAGDLVATSGSFTTMNGDDVALNIYVRPRPDEAKCDFALDALIRSMKWDEKVYGRAYDLDIFNIVAVDDFNMGAMENKGLNIFNSSCVLASPTTSTDADYERIEAIIAHEYFHNWTGNRVTCRDWFQLCLKEGLTVYRDQQFTADMRSAPVKRIDDALDLRAYQFREDAGPLAHPVRPASFVEINNFYTATVYEKGAELIGMLKLLVGDDPYAKAVTLYFDRHDGQAATIEDWLAAFADTTGRDLTQFALWYAQAGTPEITVTDQFDNGTYTLTLRQSLRDTDDMADKQPMHIPVAAGLLASSGAEVVPTTVLELTEVEQSFTFDNLTEKPIPSLLRGFSAPVIIKRQQTADERLFLLAHDTDPFNKWEAGRQFASDMLVGMVRDDAAPDARYLTALTGLITDKALDPAYRALMLALPSQDDTARALADAGHAPEPQKIYLVHESLRYAMAEHMQDRLPQIYAAMHVAGPYSPDAKDAGQRSLGNAMLGLMTRLDGGKQASAQFAQADNMTQQMSALRALVAQGHGADALAAFRTQWAQDRLVMDKWFGLQAVLASPEHAVATVNMLTQDADFNWKNPNRFRAVLGGFAANAAGFHAADGSGYALLADWLIRLDPVNPQTTARMAKAFETWPRYAPDRQAKMKAALQRIAHTPELSRDTAEMVARMLKG